MRPSKGISSKDARHEERRARRGKKGGPADAHLPRAARKAEKVPPPAKKKGKFPAKKTGKTFAKGKFGKKAR